MNVAVILVANIETYRIWVPDRTNIIQLYNMYYLPTQIYYPPTVCIIHQLFCIIHQLVCIIYQVTCIIYQNLYYLPTGMYYPPTTCIILQLRFYYPPTPVTQISQCRVCRSRLMFKLILESAERSLKNTWILCARNLSVPDIPTPVPCSATQWSIYLHRFSHSAYNLINEIIWCPI